MEKYNKNAIKKKLQTIKDDIEYCKNGITPEGENNGAFLKAIEAHKEDERICKLELAVAELQEKNT